MTPSCKKQATHWVATLQIFRDFSVRMLGATCHVGRNGLQRLQVWFVFKSLSILFILVFFFFPFATKLEASTSCLGLWVFGKNAEFFVAPS